MRTLSTAVMIFAAAAGFFGSVLATEAKGPFRAEISGGDLTEPVTIDGPLSADLVFENQLLAAKPPGSTDPAYTIKLLPADPAAGEDFVITMTYFPREGNRPAVLRGDWDAANTYFPASEEFESIVEGAIGAARPADAGAGDDGVSIVWYIAPSLAAVGLLVVGGLAGRRLMFRHDE